MLLPSQIELTSLEEATRTYSSPQYLRLKPIPMLLRRFIGVDPWHTLTPLISYSLYPIPSLEIHVALWNCLAFGQAMGIPEFPSSHTSQGIPVQVDHIPIYTSSLPWEFILTYISLIPLSLLLPILMVGYYALGHMRILSPLRYHNGEKTKLRFLFAIGNFGSSYTPWSAFLMLLTR